MRTVRAIEAGRVEIIEAPTPQVKPGHALIKTERLAICGSDIRRLYHPFPGEFPLPLGAPGHEVVGTVEAVSEDTVRIGDRALVLVPDEDAMADYFQVPAEYVLPLPEGATAEELLMAQQLGTVVFACKFLPNLIGKTAVVIGQGAAGLHWDAMLKRLGLALVIAWDLFQPRVDAGLAFGATDVFRADGVDPVEVVADLTEGLMADLVVVAAGEQEALKLAPHLVATGGRIQFFGVPHQTETTFDFRSLFRRYCFTHSTGKSSSEPGKTSYHQALRFIAEGEIDVGSMVTHRFPLERVAEAYELARTREDGAIKVVVETNA